MASGTRVPVNELGGDYCGFGGIVTAPFFVYFLPNYVRLIANAIYSRVYHVLSREVNKGAGMTRIIVTITDKMDADLKAEAKKRGATIAGVIRLYLTEGLVRDLKTNPDDYEVEVGGKRDTEE